jgi:DNA-binding response OmpR family regulator
VARIIYIHWDEAEARARVAGMQDAGYQVRVHATSGENLKLSDFKPDALVISLDRLPSHGRKVAEWFWKPKGRRKVPIVFAGGAPEKVSVIRGFFPDAVYCGPDQLVETVRRLLPGV